MFYFKLKTTIPKTRLYYYLLVVFGSHCRSIHYQQRLLVRFVGHYQAYFSCPLAYWLFSPHKSNNPIVCFWEHFFNDKIQFAKRQYVRSNGWLFFKIGYCTNALAVVKINKWSHQPSGFIFYLDWGLSVHILMLWWFFGTDNSLSVITIRCSLVDNFKMVSMLGSFALRMYSAFTLVKHDMHWIYIIQYMYVSISARSERHVVKHIFFVLPPFKSELVMAKCIERLHLYVNHLNPNPAKNLLRRGKFTTTPSDSTPDALETRCPMILKI